MLFQAKAKGIKILITHHVEREADKETFICSDYNRLRQVVINLLSNAIKYTKKDGLIKIVCKHFEANNEKKVSISV